MFQEPKKYTDNDHFFFMPKMDLEKVCNAPKDKDGVFKVLELRNGKINLVYIGFSNSGGLYNEIVNGLHFDKKPRKTGWTYQTIKDKTDALDIYWYVTNGKNDQKSEQVKMLKDFIAQTGKLPQWNKLNHARTMKKTEAEVIIGIAQYLIKEKMIEGSVQISLDGMHKKVYPKWKEKINGANIKENKNPGYGDVVASFNKTFANKIGKKELFIECKKGSYSNSETSEEYKLMREAIGQIATIQNYDPDTLYAIAVPKSKRTSKLAEEWMKSEGIRKLGIKILLIDENDNVSGF